MVTGEIKHPLSRRYLVLGLSSARCGITETPSAIGARYAGGTAPDRRFNLMLADGGRPSARTPDAQAVARIDSLH
jgi:hypothetical protein